MNKSLVLLFFVLGLSCAQNLDSFEDYFLKAFEIDLDKMMDEESTTDTETDTETDTDDFVLNCPSQDLLQIRMSDTGNDGWNGNYIQVTDCDGVTYEYGIITLESGSSATAPFCFPSTPSLVSLGGGVKMNEISWTIINPATGSELLSGNAPASFDSCSPPPETAIVVDSSVGFVGITIQTFRNKQSQFVLAYARGLNVAPNSVIVLGVRDQTAKQGGIVVDFRVYTDATNQNAVLAAAQDTTALTSAFQSVDPSVSLSTVTAAAVPSVSPTPTPSTTPSPTTSVTPSTTPSPTSSPSSGYTPSVTPTTSPSPTTSSTPSPSISASTSTIAAKSDDDDDELSDGAIAAIVVCSIVGAAAILVGLAMFFKNSPLAKKEAKAKEASKDLENL